MKGYPLSGGKVFKCKYHGYQNYDRFNKANYTDEARIKQLSKLIQFRNYTDEQLKEYYYEKIKPRINIRGKSIYHRRKVGKRYDPYRDTRRQAVSFQLDEVLRLLKKNPELEKRIIEARKLGVQTLIDKLLQVFNYQEVESPNEILWIREKLNLFNGLLVKLLIYILIIKLLSKILILKCLYLGKNQTI